MTPSANRFLAFCASRLGGEHGRVHVSSVHARASEGGQQRRLERLAASSEPIARHTEGNVAAFNAIHPDTAELFAAVLSGDFTITGFRNRDLQGKLYPAAARDAADAKRRTHRTSRLIAKLRGHGLITRVKNTRLYRLTARGLKAMWPAVRFRRIDFPSAFREAQAA